MTTKFMTDPGSELTSSDVCRVDYLDYDSFKDLVSNTKPEVIGPNEWVERPINWNLAVPDAEPCIAMCIALPTLGRVLCGHFSSTKEDNELLREKIRRYQNKFKIVSPEETVSLAYNKKEHGFIDLLEDSYSSQYLDLLGRLRDIYRDCPLGYTDIECYLFGQNFWRYKVDQNIESVGTLKTLWERQMVNIDLSGIGIPLSRVIDRRANIIDSGSDSVLYLGSQMRLVHTRQSPFANIRNIAHFNV